MSLNENLSLPSLVRQSNQLNYTYGQGEGIDFVPFDEFMSDAETADWFHSWTGNPDAAPPCFRVFGQDSTGGYVALLEQPIVFMGSEGETALLARNFYDYLWLLAAGLGPSEATSYPDAPRIAQPDLESFAIRNSSPRLSASQVLQHARDEFSNFVQFIDAQCR